MKKGDLVYTKAIGYGIISFEAAIVEHVRKGKIKLEGLNTLYDAKTGTGAGPCLGLEIRLCISPTDIARAKKEISLNE